MKIYFKTVLAKALVTFNLVMCQDVGVETFGKKDRHTVTLKTIRGS